MTPRKADTTDEKLELSDDDIRWIHAQRQMDAHADWLRGQVRIIYPWVISIIGALVAAIVWIRDHVKW